ncbi:MAG: hypothetical protein NVSMB32_01930 [Actinomycetota bacterium]
MTFLPKIPVFSPFVHVEPVPEKGMVVLSGEGPVVWTGQVFARLASWVDGRRSLTDILSSAPADIGSSQIRDALSGLVQRGHVVDASAEAADPPTPSGASVRIDALPGVDQAPLEDALLALGLRLQDDADLQVVLADDYLRSGLSAYNDSALRTGRPWLLIRPLGPIVWLGPLFNPERGGCWECLAQRLRLNRPLERWSQARRQSPEPLLLGAAPDPAGAGVATSLVALAVDSWVNGRHSLALESQVVTVDTRSLALQRHQLVWRLQCPACGEPAAGPDQIARRVELRPGRKVFTSDGGHRVVPPQATLERFGHHVSPITGVIGHLEPLGAPVDRQVLHVYRGGGDWATVATLDWLGLGSSAGVLARGPPMCRLARARCVKVSSATALSFRATSPGCGVA